MANGNGNRVIGKDWAISIGLLLAIVAAVVSIVGFAGSRFTDIELKLHDIELQLIDMEYRTADRWRATDMKLWSFELERSNKEVGLNVPDPYETLKKREGSN